MNKDVDALDLAVARCLRSGVSVGDVLLAVHTALNAHAGDVSVFKENPSATVSVQRGKETAIRSILDATSDRSRHLENDGE